ncbi:toll/interleukin-1 receptor domain-containing protein [Micromonospora sp. NPDC049836]|uniref:toll/interleukin-1 receptor domain-containing protein n=1 Tax=Micromonospora sp. NPDC049836 TaxID=3364274 RepID=UPI00379A069A
MSPREAERKVFLSYASADRPFVQRLAADLQRADTTAWIDQRMLDVGDDLARIEAAILQSDCMVVVVSAASMASGWVEREIGIAQGAGIRVLPALLDTVPGSGAERFTAMAFADFRRPQAYRRELFRLTAAIEGVPDRSWFLTGKEAVAKVRSERGPAGQLFGLSQQGVATLYCLANRREWETADTADGTSRMWITEFFTPEDGRIEPFAVVDGVVHPLPALYLNDVDPTPLPDSVVVFSCALNHRPGLSEEEARRLLEENPGETTHISRRYSRFRPLPLTEAFVDSPTAVAAALAAIFGPAEGPSRADDCLVLTKLERDKRNGRLPTWTVSIFDPALPESIVTVGVDAATAAVRAPRMRSEMLNAAFFTVHTDNDGNYVISMANQLRAIDNHIWDIPDRQAAPDGLTVAEALAAVQKYMDDLGQSQEWQLAFLSNTGVTDSFSVAASAAAGLMRPDGRAGQWVIELCGRTGEPVREGDRSGFRYAFKRLICTPDGLLEDSRIDHLTCTAPLSDSPLPDDVPGALERARDLAISSAGSDFELMSVALRRRTPKVDWYFRFYDDRDIVARVAISGDGYRLADL